MNYTCYTNGNTSCLRIVEPGVGAVLDVNVTVCFCETDQCNDDIKPNTEDIKHSVCSKNSEYTSYAEYSKDAEYTTDAGYSTDAGYTTTVEYPTDAEYTKSAEYATSAEYTTEPEYTTDAEYQTNTKNADYTKLSSTFGCNMPSNSFPTTPVSKQAIVAVAMIAVFSTIN